MKNTICKKLMWAAMNGTITKFLAAELPECDMQSLKTKIKNQYRKIRSEADDIGPITKKPLRICLTGGVIWFAAYEACEGKMDEEMFSRMITDTMQSPLFRKAFGAKDPFVAEKQRKKVVAFQTANGISDSEYNWYTDYTPGRDETEYFCTYRNYKKTLERTHTRYQIISEDEQEDGSIIVRVRKQYNDKADVAEYFQ